LVVAEYLSGKLKTTFFMDCKVFRIKVSSSSKLPTGESRASSPPSSVESCSEESKLVVKTDKEGEPKAQYSRQLNIRNSRAERIKVYLR